MKPIFYCEIEYLPFSHLSQIYEGFYRLAKNNIIRIKLLKNNISNKRPIIKVILTTLNSETYSIYYDTLDGLNWIENESPYNNLLYFKKKYKSDYYFKRSFDKKIINYAPDNCKVLPLGLNYYIESNNTFNLSFKNKLKIKIKKILPKKYHDGVLYAEDIEYLPLYNNNSKILFLTRLWDPDEINDSNLKIERKKLNDFRIECIEACKREFGNQFTGGIKEDEFSKKYTKQLLADKNITNRTNFINNIRMHNICIATTGLFGSIGWKFAEYVAGSRAIISEPLNYSIPGNFTNGVNYYDFLNKDDLLNNIQTLLSNKDIVKNMMYNNFLYYNQYVKPENLVLNTLLIASKLTPAP